MNFAAFLQNKLTDVGPEARQVFYARSEEQLLNTLRARGVTADQLTDTLDLFHKARDTYELERRAVEPTLTTSQPLLAQPGPAPSRATQDDEEPSGSQIQAVRPTARGFVLPLIVGLLIGALFTWFLSGGSQTSAEQLNGLQQSLDAQRPVFQGNLAYIRRLEAALNSSRDRTGSYPRSDSFERISSNKTQWPAEFSAILAESPAKAQKLIYRGSGDNFKLLFYLSGDCFVASVLAPEMVDPWRRFGPVDCTHYGVWTRDAVNW